MTWQSVKLIDHVGALIDRNSNLGLIRTIDVLGDQSRRARWYIHLMVSPLPEISVRAFGYSP